MIIILIFLITASPTLTMTDTQILEQQPFTVLEQKPCDFHTYVKMFTVQFSQPERSKTFEKSIKTSIDKEISGCWPYQDDVDKEYMHAAVMHSFNNYEKKYQNTKSKISLIGFTAGFSLSIVIWALCTKKIDFGSVIAMTSCSLACGFIYMRTLNSVGTPSIFSDETRKEGKKHLRRKSFALKYFNHEFNRNLTTELLSLQNEKIQRDLKFVLFSMNKK